MEQRGREAAKDQMTHVLHRSTNADFPVTAEARGLRVGESREDGFV